MDARRSTTLTLAIAALTVAASANALDPTNLGDVHPAPVQVCVDVVATARFAPYATRVYARVSAFYRPYGIEVVLRTIPSLSKRTPDGKLVLVLSRTHFLRSASPEGLGSTPSIPNAYGVAYPTLDLALIMDANRSYFGRRLSTTNLIRTWSTVLAHEVGHLLGLIHAEDSLLDGVDPEVDGFSNLMRSHPLQLDQSVLVPLQWRQVRSYLRGDAMYALVHEEHLFAHLPDIDASIAASVVRSDPGDDPAP